ncbi:hypothetical protein ACJMK2_029199 [Sinanodonta woodiana]|uniref:Superoxide dismutase copper/zinc binding domain-containing protein n=1 Tax=Sinanodonta woodiana TaxID=1069815 RepID=A0ABD3X9Z0_SINWO
MQGNPSRPKTSIRGVVLLTQRIDECSGTVGPLLIKVDVAGFPHDGRLAAHGFHLHEMSDFSNGCESFGPHYNPYQTVHGGPKDHLR